MSNPEPVANPEEEAVEQEPVVTEEQPEVVAKEPEEPVAEAEPEGGAEKVEDGLPKTKAELQRLLDETVGKTQSAWQKKLADASRAEAEMKFYKEQFERVTKGAQPVAPAEKDEIAELMASDEFTIMPKRVQEHMIREAKIREEQRKEIQELKRFQADSIQERKMERLDRVVYDMEQDEDSYPGFSDLKLKIREEAIEDPLLLQALVDNPGKWLPRLYKAMTSKDAAVLGEKALEAKIEKQIKAKTTGRPAKEMGHRKFANDQEAFNYAWEKAGMTEVAD